MCRLRNIALESVTEKCDRRTEDRQTDRETDRRTDGQTDRQTDGQSDPYVSLCFTGDTKISVKPINKKPTDKSVELDHLSIDWHQVHWPPLQKSDFPINPSILVQQLGRESISGPGPWSYEVGQQSTSPRGLYSCIRKTTLTSTAPPTYTSAVSPARMTESQARLNSPYNSRPPYTPSVTTPATVVPSSISALASPPDTSRVP